MSCTPMKEDEQCFCVECERSHCAPITGMTISTFQGYKEIGGCEFGCCERHHADCDINCEECHANSGPRHKSREDWEAERADDLYDQWKDNRMMGDDEC